METKAKLGQHLRDIRFAMLTTTTPDGHFHSRPMATQVTAFDGDLWFFTDDTSPKVRELYHNREVGVTYSDGGTHRFVAVAGTGEIVHDAEKARELWHPEYGAWFPRGLNDPHLALIRVRVRSAEVWDGDNPPQKLRVNSEAA